MAVVGRVLFSTVIDRLNQRLASARVVRQPVAALLVLIDSATRSGVRRLRLVRLLGRQSDHAAVADHVARVQLASFGVLVSLSIAIDQVIYAFGPGVVGVLRDLSGSYTLPFYGCIALELIAAALVMIRGRAGAHQDPAAS